MNVTTLIAKLTTPAKLQRLDELLADPPAEVADQRLSEFNAYAATVEKSQAEMAEAVAEAEKITPLIVAAQRKVAELAAKQQLLFGRHANAQAEIERAQRMLLLALGPLGNARLDEVMRVLSYAEVDARTKKGDLDLAHRIRDARLALEAMKLAAVTPQDIETACRDALQIAAEVDATAVAA